MTEALRLLAEIRAGIPPPRARRKQRSRYKLPLILAALKDGARLDAKAGERDPRLPSRRILAKYRDRNAKFDRDTRALLRERSLESSRRKGRLSPTPGATAWAERLPGQAYDWNAIAAKIEAGATVEPYSANRQGLPSHTLIMRRRKADPLFGARVALVLGSRFGLGRRAALDREAVLERIRCGAVIKSWPPQPGMPRKDELDRERREDRGFNSIVREAIVEARRRKKNRHSLAKLGQNAIWLAADRAVPRLNDPDLRGDIVGELSLMICDGRVAVGSDLTIAWKICRTKLAAHRWKETSLDTPIAGADRLTRLDLLSDDTPRF